MDTQNIIDEKINEIEAKENVKILYCAESGSRAWGFESKDSDYDVRFIYLHSPEWYLKLESRRDVIEWQLDNTLDINGWDIQKTLRLLYKSNPTVFEWNNSPIKYRTTPEWERISKILPQYFSSKTMIHHYLGTAVGNYREYLKGENVRLKKYFYVLRPILACEWVNERNCPPPMLFDTLKDEYLPKSLIKDVNKLLELKKSGFEMESGKRIDSLNKYLEEEITKFRGITQNEESCERSWEPLNQLFLGLIKEKM